MAKGGMAKGGREGGDWLPASGAGGKGVAGPMRGEEGALEDGEGAGMAGRASRPGSPALGEAGGKAVPGQRGDGQGKREKGGGGERQSERK